MIYFYAACRRCSYSACSNWEHCWSRCFDEWLPWLSCLELTGYPCLCHLDTRICYFTNAITSLFSQRVGQTLAEFISIIIFAFELAVFLQRITVGESYMTIYLFPGLIKTRFNWFWFMTAWYLGSHFKSLKWELCEPNEASIALLMSWHTHRKEVLCAWDPARVWHFSHSSTRPPN